jgi:phage-related holin
MKSEALNAAASAVTSNVGGFTAFIISFFSPIFAAMMAAGGLIIADTITGVMKAKKKKTPITSRRLASVLSKMLLYQILIVSAHICETYLVAELPFVKLVLGAVALVEFKSILENTSEYLGKDVVKSILDKITRK